MAGGNQVIVYSNVYENEKDDDKSIESNFVDAREKPEGKTPILKSSKYIWFVLHLKLKLRLKLYTRELMWCVADD